MSARAGRPRGRAAEWTRRLLIAGASLLLALAAAEAVLRAFRLAPVRGVHTVTQPEFERVPGLFGPGQSLVDRRKPALPYRVNIDSLGYRGADLPRKKPAGELRIVMVGDSFTFGDFVADEETVPAALERELRTLCGGRPVRVVNAGVGGSTIVSAMELARRSLALDPDRIVLLFSENDVQDLRSPLWPELARNRDLKGRFPMRWIYPAVRSTALWHVALAVRGKARARARGATAFTDGRMQTDTLAVARARAGYAELLAALRDLLDGAGAPLAVASFPSHKTFSGLESDERLRWLHAVADSLGVPAFDLLSALRATERSVEELYLLPFDGHATPAANAVAGRAIALGLSELPGVCGPAANDGARPDS